MGYILALTQVSVLIWSKNVRLWFKVIAKDTNNISYTVRYGLEVSSVGEECASHADICNLGWGFMATDYMSFVQSTGTQAKTGDQTGLVIYIEV